MTNSQGLIESFMPVLKTHNILIFFGLWYTFTVFTYGVQIPSGILLPAMILGALVGSLYHEIDLFELQTDQYRFTPIMIGAAAMLGGYMQLTYSIVVIMMETFGSVQLFVPLIIANGLSSWIASCFTQSLYER